jgi:hypothetical protein
LKDVKHHGGLGEDFLAWEFQKLGINRYLG